MSSYLTSVNPFTNRKIAQYKKDTQAGIREKLQYAAVAQKEWAALSVVQRAAYLKKLAKSLLKNKKNLAALCAAEMGKPFRQGIAEVEKCARSLEYYALNGAKFLQPIPVATEGSKSYVSFQPLGVVLAIMPWNFPYWQVYRALGPILMAGNVMVLKHAGNVTGCALEMEKIWKEAGLPEKVFQVLKVSGDAMEKVIADEHIAAITFTGSSAAGARVAAVAAAHLKKQVLELGGSDPYIILKDADIDHAVRKCAQSRLNNTGQSCIAAKRFIVVKEVAEEFTQKLTAYFKERKYGDPLNEANDLGTIARQDLRDELHTQVVKSKKKGAKILCGGIVPEGDHALYPPTVISNVKKGMPAYDEELFGPVAAIIEVENEEEAIAVANDSIYGLGGAVFSKNTKKAELIANQKIHSGFVAVNTFVSSDPRLPFGGVKQSGYGRELSYFGMHEFCNIKTVYIQ